MLSNSSKSKVVSECSKIIRLFIFTFYFAHSPMIFNFYLFLFAMYTNCMRCAPSYTRTEFSDRSSFFFAPTGKGLSIFCTVIRSGFEWCKKIGTRILTRVLIR